MNFESWVELHQRYYRSILATSFVVAVLAASLALNFIRFDFDILGMLPKGDPAYDNFRSFVEDFGELDELVILLEGEDPKELAEFGRLFGSRLAQLESVEEIHFEVDREVLNRGVFGQYLFHLMPVDMIEGLKRVFSKKGIERRLQATKRQLANPLALGSATTLRGDPLGLKPILAQHLEGSLELSAFQGHDGVLSTKDGRALLLLLRPSRNAFDGEFTEALLRDVLAIEAEVRSGFDHSGAIEFSHTGSYSFAQEDALTIRRDVERYLFLALVGVLGVFFLGYRSLRILPFVAWPLVFNSLMTLALSKLLFAELNAMSLSFTAILYGLSIDSAIHFYTRVSQEAKQDGLREALVITMRALWAPSLTASATTAGVFLLVATSSLGGIRQMALLTACGMAVNASLFYLLYPSLTLLVKGRHPEVDDLEMPRLARVCDEISGRSFALVAGLILLSASGLYFARNIELDTDLQRLRPQQSDAFNTQQRVGNLFGNPTAGTALMLRAEKLDEGLTQLEEIEVALVEEESLGGLQIISISALLPSTGEQERRLHALARLSPEQVYQDIEKESSKSGFRRGAFAGFREILLNRQESVLRYGDPALKPFAGLISRHVRKHEESFSLVTYLQHSERATVERVAEILKQEFPNSPMLLTGISTVQKRLEQSLSDEVLRFTILAFFLSLAIVWICVGNFRWALAIILPQVLVMIWILGIMANSGLGIGPVNLIVFPLILGIGVDNCVYLSERFGEQTSIVSALSSAARAVILSASTTIVGFGFLAFSDYPALAQLGGLTAIGLIFCLISAFTVLPLIRRFATADD